MTIHPTTSGPIPTNGYLLTEPGSGQAVLIDAPGGIWPEIEPILRRERCRLAEIWITHGHWDHTQGAAEAVRATGAKVRAHPADRAMIENPPPATSFLPGMKLEPLQVDAWLRAGEKLAALGTEAEVRHVPGHCPGNVLFYFPREGAVFVGDALFRGGIGRTDLPGGGFSMLEKSIRQQIYTLPDATVSYSGHGEKTTVGEEKRSNPYVRG